MNLRLCLLLIIAGLLPLFALPASQDNDTAQDILSDFLTTTPDTSLNQSCEKMGGYCLSVYSRIYCAGPRLESGCLDNKEEYCCLQL